MYDSCLCGGGEKDEVGGEHFFVLNEADISYFDLTPLYLLYLSIFEYGGGFFVVILVVTDMSLVIFIS